MGDNKPVKKSEYEEIMLYNSLKRMLLNNKTIYIEQIKNNLDK